jgi:hypothetical protein
LLARMRIVVDEIRERVHRSPHSPRRTVLLP